jgi:alkanesulfonate monooxygenase SsuD/methylene tetrahydromethanopterin reductase-like flavin-dependent oxidoreductase (luciferase family)
MRLSVVTPVLTRVPGAHARWEEDAGVAELVEIARAADRLGYHHLTCSEHVAIPTDVAEVRSSMASVGSPTMPVVPRGPRRPACSRTSTTSCCT